ncbi:max-like protein X [Watersipora subatra]|uniref:max-like protein X n=1 Tax=Watersipora subatra TaxID=2589382 RepID=UPI00355B8E07
MSEFNMFKTNAEDESKSGFRVGATNSFYSHFSSPPSSVHNSDNDDDDSDTRSTVSYKDRRREAHTFAEQKRRDAIKKGYEELQRVVPTCQQADSIGSSKLSKATILQKSIDYLQFSLQQKHKQEENLDKLRKSVMALKIMKANYQHIVKMHETSDPIREDQLPDELKFRVFQQMMDNLFLSFNSSISVSNFAELSASAFNWLEEFCKPQILSKIARASLHHATIDYRTQ